MIYSKFIFYIGNIPVIPVEYVFFLCIAHLHFLLYYWDMIYGNFILYKRTNSFRICCFMVDWFSYQTDWPLIAIRWTFFCCSTITDIQLLHHQYLFRLWVSTSFELKEFYAQHSSCILSCRLGCCYECVQ